MRHRVSILALVLAVGIVSGACLAGKAWSAPGDLLANTKISHPTLSTIGAPLDDGDEFGDAVGAMGDLDGPGPSVRALAVGTTGDDDGGDGRGAVYILFLDANRNPLSQKKISDTQGNFTAILDDNDQFGSACAWLGDLDGAGPSVAALAVGAINDDDGGDNRGAVYILYLDATGSVLSYQKISNTVGGFTGVLDNGDEFGGALAYLGDLDGAGPSVAAIAVGVNRDDDGGLDRGALYILYLNAAGTVLSNVKINTLGPVLAGAVDDTDGFGEALTAMGDLDGPGPSVMTIVTSAVSDDDGGNDRGAVYVLFINAAGSVLSYQKISNIYGNFTGLIQDQDGFGSGVAGLGDLDGAGPSAGALAVGSSNADAGGLDRGTIFVLLLDNTGNVLSYKEINAMTPALAGLIDDTDEVGSYMTALGDIDGPGGGAQVLVPGARVDDDGGVDRGAVYLWSLDGASPVGVGNVPTRAGLIGVSRVGPNPFSAGTSISFRVNVASRVRIDVWDLGGRLVRRLVDRQEGPGEHQVGWDGLDESGRTMATGTYLLRMTVNGEAATGAKAVLLR